MSHNKAFFLSLQHAAVSGVAVCLSVRRGAGSVPAGDRRKKRLLPSTALLGRVLSRVARPNPLQVCGTTRGPHVELPLRCEPRLGQL